MASPFDSPGCFRCAHPFSHGDRTPLRAVCPACDADLHCCRNCRHHNRSAHNECSEPQAEWVRDRERANHCDYFELRRSGAPAGDAAPARDARNRFEDLFRK